VVLPLLEQAVAVVALIWLLLAVQVGLEVAGQAQEILLQVVLVLQTQVAGEVVVDTILLATVLAGQAVQA
jgi:hypothetical protein